VTQQDTTPTGDGEQTERRKTPTERYHELALQAAKRQPIVPEHSLGLTRNAKGNVQIELTVRGTDLTEVEADATASFDRICDKYKWAEAAPSTPDREETP
jgi:hypothetical protein